MDQITGFLKGRKTYLLSAWIFTGAVAALANGWGDEELAVLGGAIAALTATTRAGIKKGPATLAPLVLALLMFVGCASLNRVNPATGKTGQQEIQESADQLAQSLPPPLNWILPSVTWLVLTIAAVAGREEQARAEAVQ